MNDEQKIRLADIIIGEMEKSFSGEDLPLMVGGSNQFPGFTPNNNVSF